MVKLYQKSKRKWDEVVKDAYWKEKNVYDEKKKKEFHEYVRGIKNFLPIPIIVGLSASVIMFLLYGAHFVIRSWLSWLIGLSLVTTAYTAYLTSYERKN